MFGKLIEKRRMFFIVLVAVLMIPWTVTLIFASGADKVKILILSLVLPIVIYGFMRLLFGAVAVNAPQKFIKFMLLFFIIAGILCVCVGIVYFITDFPNGLSPSFASCLGMIQAALDEAKKRLQA